VKTPNLAERPVAKVGGVYESPSNANDLTQWVSYELLCIYPDKTALVRRYGGDIRSPRRVPLSHFGFTS